MFMVITSYVELNSSHSAVLRFHTIPRALHESLHLKFNHTHKKKSDRMTSKCYKVQKKISESSNDQKLQLTTATNG